jgi:hypothetical protein
MPFIKKRVELEWTLHAQAKMRHYRLTPSRVRHVLHSPKRTEEGVRRERSPSCSPRPSKRREAGDHPTGGHY